MGEIIGWFGVVWGRLGGLGWSGVVWGGLGSFGVVWGDMGSAGGQVRLGLTKQLSELCGWRG